MGLPVRSVRLDALDGTRSARLRGRYDGDQALARDWHLQRHRALADILVKANSDELTIATDGRSPKSIAEQIVAYFFLR